MSVAAAFQGNSQAAVGAGNGDRAARDEARGQAACDVLQFVAVLVTADHQQEDAAPDDRRLCRATQADAGAKSGCADDQTKHPEIERTGELVAGDAERNAALTADEQPCQAAGDQDHRHPVEAVHDCVPSAFSRAIRARRVSRRGLRSTVSSRAGSSDITRLRSSLVIVSHAPISRLVRPQPKQKPVFASIEQTRMQGDSIRLMVVSDMG